MANELEEILKTYKQEKASGVRPATNSSLSQKPKPSYIAETVDKLDNMVYGKPSPVSNDVYSPERELELIKSGYKDAKVNATSMPSEILNEIMNNPIDTSLLAVNSEVDQVVEQLEGVRKSNDIWKKLEAEEKRKSNEAKKVSMVNESTGTQNTGIDYSMIKSIVETAIDERLSKINFRSLNEGLSRQSTPDLMVIRQTSDGKTMFIDSDNNVYECKMIPTGKKVNFRKK